MKLGQLIEYSKRNIFFKNYAGSAAGEASSRPLFIFKKRPIWGKSQWYAA